MEYRLKYLNKLSRPLLLTIFILCIFASIFTISLGLFFSNYKQNAINETKISYELSVKYYSKLIKDAMLLLDKKEIEDKFALLESLQIKLDVMNKEFEIRMNEV